MLQLVLLNQQRSGDVEDEPRMDYSKKTSKSVRVELEKLWCVFSFVRLLSDTNLFNNGPKWAVVTCIHSDVPLLYVIASIIIIIFSILMSAF